MKCKAIKGFLARQWYNESYCRGRLTCHLWKGCTKGERNLETKHRISQTECCLPKLKWWFWSGVGGRSHHWLEWGGNPKWGGPHSGISGLRQGQQREPGGNLQEEKRECNSGGGVACHARRPGMMENHNCFPSQTTSCPRKCLDSAAILSYISYHFF